MDLTPYRARAAEQSRIADLLRLIPQDGHTTLDVGTRDGYLAKLLADRHRHVVALDLEMPQVAHPHVECVKGDITDLAFDDGAFDLVVCTEVLEHIAPHLLEKACAELTRVTRKYLLIGVPYSQDIRVGRTTCRACGTHNPPWGHVNSFGEGRLCGMFPQLSVEQVSHVGSNTNSTNAVSTFLMDLAGNPYGTYAQEEACIACGARLEMPTHRTLFERVLTRAAFLSRRATEVFALSRPIWIHLLLAKRQA